MRKAILRPAEDVSVSVEAALVERLVTDAAGEPGVLPLIQETLVLLWEHLERRFLPLRAYEDLVLVLPRKAYGALGSKKLTGLQVAIARRADAALADLSEEESAIARRIFLRLIQFGEGRADTRRQQTVEQLRASGEDSHLFDQTLLHLADCRLLTLSGEEDSSRKADIAHEALISGWPTLQQWIIERRDAEQTRRRLAAKAEEWVRLGKSSGGLLDEIELAEAARWLNSPDAADLGYDERLPALIEASDRAIQEARKREEKARQRELELTRAALKQERKARKAAQTRNTIATISAGILLVLAGITFNQIAWRKHQAIEALSASSSAFFASHQEIEALMEGIEAGRKLNDFKKLPFFGNLKPETEFRVLAALRQVIYGVKERNRLSHSGKIASVSFGPDDQTIASASKTEGTIILWSRDGSSSKTLPEIHDQVWSIDFSPDGQKLASVSSDTIELLQKSFVV